VCQGVPCFGPKANAAIIESSKAWSKDFMSRHMIRTAQYQNFSDIDQAKAYVNSIKHRVVVKV
jgi:phosphoribosylamine--glycine ligase / phosphoribosylformylglycinamidine cyclo-ligase